MLDGIDSNSENSNASSFVKNIVHGMWGLKEEMREVRIEESKIQGLLCVYTVKCNLKTLVKC